MNLITDIQNNKKIMSKLQDQKYAQRMYAAFCNVLWTKDNCDWDSSWRAAGSHIAELRNVGETYMNWYCSGLSATENGLVMESVVSDDILNDLSEIGWSVKHVYSHLTKVNHHLTTSNNHANI